MTAVQASPEQWTRIEKVQYLLDQWDSIFDPNVTSPLGAPGDGSGVALMPRMASHPSVVELARCLALLHAHAPGQYAHVKAYRCGAEWRIRTDRVKRRRPSGKGFETVDIRRRDRIVPSWVRLERVRRGEQFLAAAFRGEVFIPSELWDALHRPAVAA